MGGTFCFWDAEKGEWIGWVSKSAAVWGAAFSPDGRRVVTTHDNTARIWDVESSEEIVALKGHRDTVRSVEFSADGTRVLTTSDDRTVRIWDVTWATLPRGDELRERARKLGGIVDLESDADVPGDARPDLDLVDISRMHGIEQLERRDPRLEDRHTPVLRGVRGAFPQAQNVAVETDRILVVGSGDGDA